MGILSIERCVLPRMVPGEPGRHSHRSARGERRDTVGVRLEPVLPMPQLCMQ